jgi:hypothetical protein
MPKPLYACTFFDRSISLVLAVTTCNIPTQGLTGLIGYSYQEVATSFLEAHLERTLKLSVLGLERWVTDQEVLPGCARVSQNLLNYMAHMHLSLSLRPLTLLLFTCDILLLLRWTRSGFG